MRLDKHTINHSSQRKLIHVGSSSTLVSTVTKKPRLVQIVAQTKNGTIGHNGRMPWRMPSDLRLFQKLTLGKPCLMGRKTWESLPSPLKGRPNLVLTRDTYYKANGAEIFHDLNSLIGRGFELAGQLNVEEVCVIGGAQLYEATLQYCDIVYMTEIDAAIDGDTRYPSLSDGWKRSKTTDMETDKRDEYAFAFSVFNRVASSRPNCVAIA